jgi:hypothetical protein
MADPSTNPVPEWLRKRDSGVKGGSKASSSAKGTARASAVCAACRHHRAPAGIATPLQRHFAQEGAGPQVLEALRETARDERSARAGELQDLADRVEEARDDPNALGLDEWPTRPTSQSYCGVDERADVFRIAEIKNRDGECSQFDEGENTGHTCESCRHNRLSGGRVVLEWLRNVFAAHPPDGLNQHAQLQQQYELSVASQIPTLVLNRGIVQEVPPALPYCNVLSTRGAVVVSIVENPSGTCPLWEPGTPQPADALEQLGQLYRSAEGQELPAEAQRAFVYNAMRYLGLQGSFESTTNAIVATRSKHRSDMAARALGIG